MLRMTIWRAAIGRAVLLAVTAALIPLPAAAADGRPAPKPPKATTIKASVEKIAATDFDAPGARMTNKAVRAQSGTMGDRSFFKTRPGVIALAVLAAGVGYAVYSAKNDRITSPAKQ